MGPTIKKLRSDLVVVRAFFVPIGHDVAEEIMAALVVVGSQWGDEGKGKIVDLLAKDADVIVRYQGGSNAGHTVITDKGIFIFHLIPSGILYRGKLCVLGNGVAIDPGGLIGELDGLKKNGIAVGKRFLICQRAHVIMPYHKAIDKAAEQAKGARRIGTTGRGIGCLLYTSPSPRDRS